MQTAMGIALQDKRSPRYAQGMPQAVASTATPSQQYSGPLAGDINTAMSRIQNRMDTRGEGYENELASQEDRQRLSLIEQLQQLAADPSRSATWDNAVQQMMGQARTAAADQAGAARGQVVQSAAQRGLWGSREARAKAGIAGAHDSQVRQAAEQADTWRTGQQRQWNDYLANALQQIISPTEAMQGVQQAGMQGAQTGMGLTQMLADANRQAGQIDANAIGGFLSNTVTPMIGSLYNTYDQRRQNDYQNNMLNLYGMTGVP